MTFRSLVILALENALDAETESFQLRDASFGGGKSASVSSEDINAAIDDLREPQFKL